MRVINYTEPIIIDNFLTHDECDSLVNNEGENVPSVISEGKEHILDKTWRNCSQKIVKDGNYDKNLLSKICVQSEKYFPNVKYTMEPPSILQYKPTEYYRPHYDSRNCHNRHYTIVVALNDGYEGGETEFPNLKREYKLKKGQALFFHNRDMDGNLTHYSYHGGKIVKSGEKWICNLWITIDRKSYCDSPGA